MCKTKYHRDGTVTIWNVYTQGWERMPAEEVSDRILAGLFADERQKICKMADKERRTK